MKGAFILTARSSHNKVKINIAHSVTLVSHGLVHPLIAPISILLSSGRFLTVTWGPGCDGGLSSSIRLFWMDSLRSRLVWGSVASRWLGGLAAVVDAGTGLADSPIERTLVWFAFLGPGRRRPHLHDGINRAAVSLCCRSTEVVG